MGINLTTRNLIAEARIFIEHKIRHYPSSLKSYTSGDL